jgi:hypothetical protein
VSLVVDADPAVEEFLSHFGVKGMHWGVRKDRTPAEQEKHDRRVKTAAIVGSAVGIALVAAGSAYVAKNNGISVSRFESAVAKKGESAAKEFAKPQLKEPTGIVLATRTRNRGSQFLLKGGLDDALPEYLKAGFGDSIADNSMKKFGGKVAVSFNDPEGRKDAAGRIINHEVILPESLSGGISNFESARSKAWPLIKDQYEKFHQSDN